MYVQLFFIYFNIVDKTIKRITATLEKNSHENEEKLL